MIATNTPHGTTASSRRAGWTVGRKLGVLVGGLMVLLVVNSVHSLSRMDQIGQEMHRFNVVDAPLLAKVAEIEVGQLEQHIALERFALALVAKKDPADHLRKFDDESKTIEREFDEVFELIGDGESRYAGIKAELTELRRQQTTFERHAHEFVDSKEPILVRIQGMASIENEADVLDERLHEARARVVDLSRAGVMEAEQHEVAAFRVTMILGVLGILAGVFASIWLLRRMTTTIAELRGHAEALARGDLTVEPLEIRSSDELGRLAESFNVMVVSIGRQVSETRSSVDALTRSSMEILGAAKEQAAATQEQAATIQQITASLEQIGQSGSQIASRAREVGDRATRSSEASEAGREAVRATCVDMESIRVQIEDVAENIVALSEKTQAVGEIIAAVNDIAEQSNLLALNAAIEAAAAGEHGARFSVVANEIKTLADQAKDSTRQVRKILGEIQKGIHGAVMLTEEAVKRADAGKEKAESTESSIEDLVESTQESVDTFQQIVAGSSQQQIGITQITQGMQDIRQAAEQSATGTSQLEGAVANLNALGKQLKSTVAEYVV